MVLSRLPLSPEQQALFERCTGRTKSLEADVKELVLICGRRGGKSLFCAFAACFYATRDYSAYLGPGERVSVAILASDRGQVHSIFNDISGMLKESAFAGRSDRRRGR